MSDSLVTVYVLCYERPEFLDECLQSVLQQDYPNLEIVISDNSQSDKIEKLIRNSPHKEKFKYIRRRPSLKPVDHFNKVLTEISSQFFMIFHDDDVLLPSAISTLHHYLSQDPLLAAVAANAYLLKGHNKTSLLFSYGMKKNRTITGPTSLAQSYLDHERTHPPFPIYLYRSKLIEGIKFNYSEGRKHADVSFLAKVAMKGSFFWLKEPLMYYRKHQTNDSAHIDLEAITSLCRFLGRTTKISPVHLANFKRKNHVLWSKQNLNKKVPSRNRKRIIQKSAILYIFNHPKFFFKYTIKKIYRDIFEHKFPRFFR